VGDFKLQVGDVVTLQEDGQRPLYVLCAAIGMVNFNRIGFDGETWYPRWKEHSDVMNEAKAIHRPTPSGLVQVWPEVQ
jgi:hypothetical protein